MIHFSSFSFYIGEKKTKHKLQKHSFLRYGKRTDLLYLYYLSMVNKDEIIHLYYTSLLKNKDIKINSITLNTKRHYGLNVKMLNYYKNYFTKNFF